MKLRYILNEAAYDSIVLKISRSLINLLNDILKQHRDSAKTFNVKKAFRLPWNENVILIISFNVNINPEGLTTAFKFDSKMLETKNDDTVSVIINLDINRKYVLTNFNELIAELKNILRHEIEHITVDPIVGKKSKSVNNDSNKYYDMLNPSGDIDSEKTFEYLSNPEEIAAMVHGLNKESKTSKQNIISLFSRDLQRFIDSDSITLNQANEILAKWISYAQKANIIISR